MGLHLTEEYLKLLMVSKTRSYFEEKDLGNTAGNLIGNNVEWKLLFQEHWCQA